MKKKRVKKQVYRKIILIFRKKQEKSKMEIDIKIIFEFYLKDWERRK